MIDMDSISNENVKKIVNEYYKSNELQLAIKNICNTTIKWIHIYNAIFNS